MILADDAICFLASKKKIEFLRKLEDAKPEDTGVPEVRLLVRDRVSHFMTIKIQTQILHKLYTIFYCV